MGRAPTAAGVDAHAVPSRAPTAGAGGPDAGVWPHKRGGFSRLSRSLGRPLGRRKEAEHQGEQDAHHRQHHHQPPCRYRCAQEAAKDTGCQADPEDVSLGVKGLIWRHGLHYLAVMGGERASPVGRAGLSIGIVPRLELRRGVPLGERLLRRARHSWHRRRPDNRWQLVLPPPRPIPAGSRLAVSVYSKPATLSSARPSRLMTIVAVVSVTVEAKLVLAAPSSLAGESSTVATIASVSASSDG